MNIIVTDCTGDKNLALHSIARKHFGPSGFKILAVEKKHFDTPTTFSDIEKVAGERINHIRESFDKAEYIKDTIYYATLQKGFFQSLHKTWLFVAYALFRKENSAWYPGTGESVAVLPELSPFILLSEKDRYEKFYELFPELEKITSLVGICGGIDEEVEWYKRAFNACMKTAIKS